ncbi:DUF3078 domain-containing protein [Tenuifilum thalassicum]|jgi:hypothetical protein|uniref:DUF3078 domain-containing protein n=1 Tax=Tenuifilum thalassicum TaxID=2590900 RepID=A0A7D3XNK1_9BACT|nr:DUF3078 domain-containing protein [Tenuifilum thalassicum]QKG80996.1 DUF3078 domain-containing protein [Tenuifilum thalassicum]
MTKKILSLQFIMLLAAITAFGQLKETTEKLKSFQPDTIKGWKKGIALGINVNQTSLTNWAAGGQSSFALNSVFSGFINYKSPNASWVNTIDLGYGILSQEDVKYIKKTDDKIDVLSKFGRKASKNFYYAALLNFKTQFSTGYNYPNDSTRTKISNFFAPAYLVGAVGMDYKPNDYLSAFYAPLTGKVTFVTDTMLSNAGAFGVEKGKQIKNEFGGYLRIVFSKNDFKPEWLKNLTLTSKLDLFSNYLENPQNIVVNWETLVIMKVNQYINVNLNTQLIYDDKVKIAKDTNHDGIIDSNGPRVQFKEIFGVGITFKL